MVVAKLSPMGSTMGDSNWNLFFYEVSQCHFLCLYSESIILLLFLFRQGEWYIRSVLKEKRTIQSFVSFKSRKCHQEFTAVEREILFENNRVGWEKEQVWATERRSDSIPMTKLINSEY